MDVTLENPKKWVPKVQDGIVISLNLSGKRTEKNNRIKCFYAVLSRIGVKRFLSFYYANERAHISCHKKGRKLCGQQ